MNAISCEVTEQEEINYASSGGNMMDRYTLVLCHLQGDKILLPFPFKSLLVDIQKYLPL